MRNRAVAFWQSGWQDTLMVKARIVLVFIACSLLASFALGQGRTGLPLDLDYGMSRDQALNHLKALDMYRIGSSDNDTIAYVVPAPDSNTKNGFFLEFDNGLLVEIAAMETEMNHQLYESYMKSLLEQAKTWKDAGMEAVIEDKGNALYQYMDNRSIVGISGSPMLPSKDKYSVQITFTEKLYYQQKLHDGR